MILIIMKELDIKKIILVRLQQLLLSVFISQDDCDYGDNDDDRTKNKIVSRKPGSVLPQAGAAECVETG